MANPSTRAAEPTAVIDTADGWMSINEIATYFEINRAYVYTLMSDGRLPYVKLGSRRRVKMSDVKALEKSLR
jgi:excisionase family DNA binding protein